MSYVYFYIAGTIIFTVYSQIILKFRMAHYGSLPPVMTDKLIYLTKLLLDPLILTGLLAAFFAAIFWLAALSTKIELSKAYPFTILSLVLVVILSVIFFKEPVNIYMFIGVALIVIGVFFISKTLS